ncbi:TonB-dependent receptor plug domain-containing protein [Desulfoglaeba alkanexedens]|uniref:TonB-dependent receptor n=1 Tax=Desulfoglaeba alkanexedens ALDC TaxID=980445 RepID=A0A4P8L4H4_9BACT|nr:TonB-dependent receptor [Desulfoglaeba alkanexedens]QCQ21682.1 TonB-dependent receptor [Desulfoglaeba alkanexedens ALDC]
MRRFAEGFFGLVLWLLFMGTATGGGNGEMPGEPVVLDEVVVTATRTETPAREVGVSHEVITKEEIQARQAADVAEVLQEVAGFTLMRTGSLGSQTVLFPRGGESNHTLVLIDGVQVNLGGGDFYWETLSTDNIERVEVVRGPQSALYGSDALGGVVQIFTQPGVGPAALEVSTSHGIRSDEGNYLGTQRLRVSGGKDDMGFSAAYGRIDDEGILEVNNAFENNTLSTRFDFYPTSAWDVTLTGRLVDSRYEYPTESAGDKFSPLDPHQNERELDTVVGVSSKVMAASWWENVFSVGYHRNQRKIRDPLDLGVDFVDTASKSTESRTTFDYHANVSWETSEAFRTVTTFGAEYEGEDYDQETRDYAVTRLRADRSNTAGYVQEHVSFWGRLHLTGGVRFEDNTEFGGEVSPRGSVALDLHETGTRLRFAAGRGIKEPTFYENFADDPWTLGNPDLEPETATSWEVGVDQSWLKDRLSVHLTYFDTRYEDLIAYVPSPFPAPPERLPNFFNVQDARSRGIEGQAEFRPRDALALGLNITFLDTEVIDDGGLDSVAFTEDEELLRRPETTVSGWLDWRWKRFRTFVKGLYVGSRDDVDYRDWASPERVQLSDYFLLDTVVSCRVPWGFTPEDLEVFVKGSNILDEDYEDVFGFSTPGASFMLGLSFKR